MRKLTTKEFVEKARSKHGNRYDYEKVIYVNGRGKVIITCGLHGQFSQLAKNHLKGCGCNKCGGIARGIATGKAQTLSTKEFIVRANKVHNNHYDYSLVQYVTSKTHVSILCPKHGEFEQTPTSHLQGKNCPSCCVTGFDPTEPAILYYLSVNDNEAYKVGITNRSVKKRFCNEDLSKITVTKEWPFELGQDAYDLEQQILKTFRLYKYKGPGLLKSGNTELFVTDILPGILDIIKKKEGVTMRLPIETRNPLFGLYLYPKAKEIMEEQQDKSWASQEIPVDKDIADYRSSMSVDQYNMVAVTLQLFVELEQTVGEVWDKIGTWFPHSEIEGCTSEIARMEKSVHAFFYQKMADVLNIDPEETAKSQEEIQVLKSKLTFLKAITSNLSDNKALSLATVTLIEQVLLFSNFAMLKSFQSNGHNLIPNTITGVEFVVQDETLHGDFAAYLFRTYLNEVGLSEEEGDVLKEEILALLEEVIRHEDAVIEYIFGTHEEINDITKEQLKTFIRFRANESLELLGYAPLYIIRENPIKEWFYRGKSTITQHDFFASGTSQYRRNWKYDNFSVLELLKGDS